MSENSQESADTDPTKVETNRKAQILSGLLVSLFTIFLFLGTLELIAFLWERKTAQGDLGWTLVASRRMPLTRHGDEDNPYYLLEADEDYFFEGIPVHINSLGFRDEEVELPKPPNTYRILNVGDSVAFGWKVNLEDSYGKQLEVLLNTQDDGTNYEVINVGVPGWTIDTAHAFITQEGLQYDPDLVVLDITLVNDIYGKEPTDRKGLFQWLRDHTFSWPFLTTQLRFLLARQVGPEAIPVLLPRTDIEYYFPVEEESPVWDSIWDSIQSIKTAVKAEGVPFVIVAFPTAYQLNSESHPDLPQQILADRSSENNVNYIDLLPIYREICLEVGAEACEGYKNLLFADIWMHPSTFGHKLAAEAIHDWQTRQ